MTDLMRQGGGSETTIGSMAKNISCSARGETLRNFIWIVPPATGIHPRFG